MTYAIGAFIGFLGGFFTAALLRTGKRADEEVELYEYGPGATG